MPEFDRTPEWSVIEERLLSATILWLATVTPQGLPHLVPVWFWWDGQAVWILSQPNSQKVINLHHQANVVASVDDSDDGHKPIVFRAIAELLPAPPRDRDLQGYIAKYTPLMTEMNWDPDEMLTDFSQVIRLRPIRFVEFA